MEVWRKVPGSVGSYGEYQISSLGRVRCLKNNGNIKYLKPTGSGNKNYHAVAIPFTKGGNKKRRIHQLVLEAFVGPRPTKHCAAHLNGDSFDNKLCNLKWVTYSENSNHRKEHGTVPKEYPKMQGELNHWSKLKNFEIPHIKLWKSEGFSYAQIAKAYGVSSGCVAHIIKGRSYKTIR